MSYCRKWAYFSKMSIRWCRKPAMASSWAKYCQTSSNTSLCSLDTASCSCPRIYRKLSAKSLELLMMTLSACSKRPAKCSRNLGGSNKYAMSLRGACTVSQRATVDTLLAYLPGKLAARSARRTQEARSSHLEST
jgi:hypothetical protein